jgi:predicted PurR-regulated permease PerM
LVSKNPVTIFLLFIVGFLGSLVGLVGCCIGVIFTVVFNSSVTYSAYFSIFNEEEQQDSIDSIGRSDLE